MRLSKRQCAGQGIQHALHIQGSLLVLVCGRSGKNVRTEGNADRLVAFTCAFRWEPLCFVRSCSLCAVLEYKELHDAACLYVRVGAN